MINLLPDTNKLEIRAARTNVLLVRYIAILVTASLVLGGLLAGSYIVLSVDETNATTAVSENTNRINRYEDVKKRIESFRADLSAAKSILDQQVSYSGAIYKIANTIPKNVILDDLTADPNKLEITLNARAKTYKDGARLKDDLAKKTDVYSSVKLQSLRNSTSGTNSGGTSDGGAPAATDTRYPVEIKLAVTLNKDIFK